MFFRYYMNILMFVIILCHFDKMNDEIMFFFLLNQ